MKDVKFLTVAEVATIMRVSKMTARHLVGTAARGAPGRKAKRHLRKWGYTR